MGIKIDTGIKDIYIDRSFGIILKTDGKVIDIGETRTAKRRATVHATNVIDNIKSLIYNSSINNQCLMLSNNGDLYLFSSNKKTKPIATNVIDAHLTEMGDTSVLYINEKGELHNCHTNKNPVSIKKPGKIEEVDTYTDFRDNIIFESGVKMISSSFSYLFVTDTSNKVWLYKKNLFYSELRDNEIHPKQDVYKKYNIRHMIPDIDNEYIFFIDENNNLYETPENIGKIKLLKSNILQFYSGQENAFIELRTFPNGSFVSLPNILTMNEDDNNNNNDDDDDNDNNNDDEDNDD